MKKTRHLLITGILAVLLLSEAVFLTYGFHKVEKSYVDTYLAQEQQYVEQINVSLEYMLRQGAGQKELADYMQEYVPVSGSYYAWLAKDESMIFVKNETVTDSLGEEGALPVFRETIQDKETCNVSAEFSYNGAEYITGMVVDKSYILDNPSFQSFKMYGAVSLSVLGLLMFAVILVYVQGFWKGKKRNFVIAEQLRNKNSVLDEMQEDMGNLSYKLQRQEYRPEERRSYDSQMAKKLLEKSDRADIQPVHYAAFQLEMDEGQYYGKQQIMNIMEKVVLDKRHVRLEIQKGCFLVMFYRTQQAEVEEILKNAKKQWENMDVILRVNSGMITPGTAERQWLDEFLERKGNRL